MIWKTLKLMPYAIRHGELLALLRCASRDATRKRGRSVMKLLSLWEPWASLMAVGAKKIETRSWSVNYRGWLAIHAAKRWQQNEKFFSGCNPCAAALGAGWMPSLGNIVAIVRLVECTSIVRCTQCPPANVDPNNPLAVDLNPSTCEFCQDIGYHPLGSKLSYPESEFGNYDAGRFAWLTDNLFRLPDPIPFNGKQYLIDVPADVLTGIREQWKHGRSGR